MMSDDVSVVLVSITLYLTTPPLFPSLRQPLEAYMDDDDKKLAA